MTFESYIKIREWLQQNHYFSDCFVDYELIGDEITLVIEKIEEGENIAGQKQLARRITIACKNSLIIPYSNSEFAKQAKNRQICQLLPFEEMIGLHVSLWGNGFYIASKSLEVSETDSFKKKVAPVTSPNSVSFYLSKHKIPKGLFWLEELKKLNLPSEFIGYFGEVYNEADVADLGYLGCSIRPKNLSYNHKSLAVSFSCCDDLEDPVVKLSIELQNAELADYWQHILSLATKIDFTALKTGNVILTHAEGITFLKNRELPKRLKD